MIFAIADHLSLRSSPLNGTIENASVIDARNSGREGAGCVSADGRSGVANLKLQQKKKKERQQANSGLTATVTSSSIRFDVNMPLDPNRPNDPPFFTGFNSVQTITLLQDGKPVAGATGTEAVTGTKGEKIEQNPRPVTTNADGQIFDLVGRGGPDDGSRVDRATAIKLYNENALNPVDVTTRQPLTLNLPGGGAAQIAFLRRLTNLDDKGNLRPTGPPK
jgi:hypothetical protein